MAASKVSTLTAELEVMVKDIERMQEEYPDKQFPEDIADRWDRTNKTIDEYKKRIELARREERLEELQRTSAGALEGPEKAGFQIGNSQWRDKPYDISGIQRDWNDPEKEGQQFRDRALHIVERDLRVRDHRIEQDEAKEAVTAMIEELDSTDGALSRHIVVNSSPDYKKAFGKYLAGAFFSEAEARTLQISRALSLTSAAGGYAVPVELDPTIMPTSSLAINPLRSIATVRQITVDTFNGVTSGAVTAAYQAEATPTTDTSPTIGQVVISTERASSFIPFSIEIGQDWGALQSEMARLLQDAKDVLETTKFTLGSGTNEPFGVITGATTVFTGSSATGFTIADLTNWDESLPPRFQPNASAMFNKAMASRIRRIDAGVVGGAGSGVWVDNLRIATGEGRNPGAYSSSFLGYPAYQNTAMSGTFTTGQLVGLLGDFSYYYIIDRVGMNIEVIPHLFDVTFNQPTGQRGLYAYWRNGAKVVDAAAFRTLKLG